jgi:hypothetical protein
MREAVTHIQRICMTPRYLATGNNNEDLKFPRVTAQSTGIIVLETWLLLGRLTATERILRNAVYRLFNMWCNTLCQSNTVYCAKVTLIVQGRADEPLARGKISLAHNIHCCLNLLVFFSPYQRLYIVKNIRVYTHVWLRTDCKLITAATK